MSRSARQVVRWIAVAGPTAGGKSALALSLAERLGGEIVNADSRQVFRGMDVGTAKPTPDERRRVPHHLFDVVDPDEPFDAAIYRDLAREAVAEIDARGRVPIVVGGTGLYLRALARGLFSGPPASPRLRAVLDGIERERAGSLARWCRALDPETAGRLHPNDAVRLARAIEVVLTSGEPLSRLQKRHAFADRFGTSLLLVVDPGPATLDHRIRVRSRRMFEDGLLDELRRLRERYDPGLRPLRAIGYREAAEVLEGRWTVDRAIDELVRSTKRFARRQRIWFRAEAEAVWVDPEADGEAGLVERVAGYLASGSAR